MPISFDDQLKTMDSLIDREKKFVVENKTRYASSFIARKQRDIEVFEVVRETVRVARQNQAMTGMGGKPIVSDTDEIRDALAKLDGDPPYHGAGNLCLHDGIYMKSIERKFGATITELRERVARSKQ